MCNEYLSKVIQQNAYSLYIDNLLWAILTDSRWHIRQLAIDKLKGLFLLGMVSNRELKPNTEAFRIFMKSKINFNADEYFSLNIEPN